MPPRFSLKGLLIVIGVLSVCLGGLRWLLTHDWTLVEEIALPKNRAVQIRTDAAWEAAQPYYAEIWDSGQMISRCYLFSISGGTSPSALDFNVETAAGGDLIALTEAREPNVLLLAHDFRTGLSWPRPDAFEAWRQTALRGQAPAAAWSAAYGRESQRRSGAQGRGLNSEAKSD